MVCTLQLTCIVIVYGSEVLSGFHHVHADFDLSFAAHTVRQSFTGNDGTLILVQILPFWVAFVLRGVLWTTLPMGLLLRSLSVITAHCRYVRRTSLSRGRVKQPGDLVPPCKKDSPRNNKKKSKGQ
jgi:hypothetical protein